MSWLSTRLKGSLEHFRTFRRLGRYTGRANNRDFKTMIVIMVIGIMLHSAEPYIWCRTITSIQNQLLGIAMLCLCTTCGLRLVTNVLDFWRRIVRDRFQGRLRRNLNLAFQRLFLQKSVGEYKQEGTLLSAEHMRKGEEHAVSIEDTMMFEGYGVLIELLVTFIFLCLISPAVGALIFGVLTFNAVVNLWLTQRIQHEFTPIQQRWRKLDSFLEERIAKVVHVKIHGQEENTLQRYRDEFDSVFVDDHRFWRSIFSRMLGRDCMNVGLWLGILSFGLLQVRWGWLDVGAFLTVLLWTQSVLDKIWRLVETENRLSRLMPSVKLTLDALELPSIMVEAPDATIISDVASIEFRDVSFGFNGSPDGILRDITFTARRGDRVAIVGPSGAGKTTLISLLQRHVGPRSGDIFIDGIPLPKLKLRQWRRIVGLVPQRVDLLDGTVSENIRFGVPDRLVDLARIRRVADQCQILQIGARLQEGLETRIGEDGVQLSGGERQRIAWAIAMVKDPAILIVDEG